MKQLVEMIRDWTRLFHERSRFRVGVARRVLVLLHFLQVHRPRIGGWHFGAVFVELFLRNDSGFEDFPAAASTDRQALEPFLGRPSFLLSLLLRFVLVLHLLELLHERAVVGEASGSVDCRLFHLRRRINFSLCGEVSFQHFLHLLVNRHAILLSLDVGEVDPVVARELLEALARELVADFKSLARIERLGGRRFGAAGALFIWHLDCFELDGAVRSRV